MNKKTITIIIVETSHIIYEGVSKILTNSGQSFTLHQADNLNELYQLNLRYKADIILVNPVMIQNLLKEFQSLKKEFNTSHWIGIVYTHFDSQLLSWFEGIVSINDTPNEIISLIHKMLSLDQPVNIPNQQQETLSERETDVLKLLVTGNANKEIADKLSISTNTVITHRKNISQKTGIKSVSGLTIYAVVNNFISIDSYQE